MSCAHAMTVIQCARGVDDFDQDITVLVITAGIWPDLRRVLDSNSRMPSVARPEMLEDGEVGGGDNAGVVGLRVLRASRSVHWLLMSNRSYSWDTKSRERRQRSVVYRLGFDGRCPTMLAAAARPV
ncbi:MAG: hypothetical protein O3B84_05235, partial [Chloroflexi bacterium]|nr:hypothetical protein [Chloroflexota bacterium]